MLHVWNMFAYIYHKSKPNRGKYSIHSAHFGYDYLWWRWVETAGYGKFSQLLLPNHYYNRNLTYAYTLDICKMSSKNEGWCVDSWVVSEILVAGTGCHGRDHTSVVMIVKGISSLSNHGHFGYPFVKFHEGGDRWKKPSRKVPEASGITCSPVLGAIGSWGLASLQVGGGYTP